MAAIASVTPSPDAFINALLSNYKWASGSLTYSFPSSYTYYESPYGSNEPLRNFEGLNATQQSAVRAAFANFAAVANVTFTELTGASAANATLRLAMSDAPSTAWGYMPHTAAEGGDSWYNNASGVYDNPLRGNYAYSTFLHEIGHTLGLEHPHENGMPVSGDSMEFSVMSYRAYVGAPLTGYPNESWGFAQSIMMYDIAAVQHLYGANFSSNSGNTTYSWSPTTGQAFIDGVGQATPGANRIFQTVWDGGGTDAYDFSNYGTNLNIDLRPGQWTTTSSAQLAWLHYSGSPLADGNIANALQYDGDVRSLIENVIGGSGSDIIVGNDAANRLEGGAGNDFLDGGYGLDFFDGGGGSDTVSYAWFSGGLDFDLARGELKDIGSSAVAEYLIDIENIIGTSGSDLIRGSGGANRLEGGAGNDQLFGMNEDDFLDGGYGLDFFDGGGGSDTVSYAWFSGGLDFDLSRGELKDIGSTAVAEYLINIENIIGTSGSDLIRGSGGANRLEGGAGDDQLFGMNGDDFLDGGYGLDFFDGGGGSDTVSYAWFSGGLDFDLARGELKDIGSIAAAEYLINIDNIIGTSGNDIIRGSSAVNRLEGGAGNDQIIGKGGADLLFGQTGADTFVLERLTDSTVDDCDSICDFTSGADRIDLRQIDANSNTPGDQIFSFIGESNFSAAGQIRFSGSMLTGDVNGDGVADFQINVLGVSALVAHDFWL